MITFLRFCTVCIYFSQLIFLQNRSPPTGDLSCYALLALVLVPFFSYYVTESIYYLFSHMVSRGPNHFPKSEAYSLCSIFHDLLHFAAIHLGTVPIARVAGECRDCRLTILHVKHLNTLALFRFRSVVYFMVA